MIRRRARKSQREAFDNGGNIKLPRIELGRRVIFLPYVVTHCFQLKVTNIAPCYYVSQILGH